MKLATVCVLAALLFASNWFVVGEEPSCLQGNGEPRYKSRDPVDGNTYETTVNTDFQGHMIECQLCDVVVNNFVTEIDRVARDCIGALEGLEGEEEQDDARHEKIFTGPRGRKCAVLPKFDKGETASEVPSVVSELQSSMCEGPVLDWMPIITEEVLEDDERTGKAKNAAAGQGKDELERFEKQMEEAPPLRDRAGLRVDRISEETWPDTYPPPPEEHKKVVMDHCAATFLGNPAEKKRFLTHALKHIPSTVHERTQLDLAAIAGNYDAVAKSVVTAQNLLCKNLCGGEARPTVPQKILGWSFSGKRMAG